MKPRCSPNGGPSAPCVALHTTHPDFRFSSNLGCFLAGHVAVPVNVTTAALSVFVLTVIAGYVLAARHEEPNLILSIWITSGTVFSLLVLLIHPTG